MGLGNLAAVALVVSGSISASPAVADACNPESLGASPSLVIRTSQSPERGMMGIRIENHFEGVEAILVSFESEVERLDQLLIAASRSASGGKLPADWGSVDPAELVSTTQAELVGDYSHMLAAPADPESRVVVRLYFGDGAKRVYSVCEASSTARLSVTPSSYKQAGPSPRPPGTNCECIRLECSGATVCSIEKECCGSPLIACSCCSCGSNNSCQITCDLCDHVP